MNKKNWEKNDTIDGAWEADKGKIVFLNTFCNHFVCKYQQKIAASLYKRQFKHLPLSVYLFENYYQINEQTNVAHLVPNVTLFALKLFHDQAPPPNSLVAPLQNPPNEH